jgi:hypothetical protein
MKAGDLFPHLRKMHPIPTDRDRLNRREGFRMVGEHRAKSSKGAKSLKTCSFLASTGANTPGTMFLTLGGDGRSNLLGVLLVKMPAQIAWEELIVRLA